MASTKRPSYRECLEAGMCTTEVAEARGVNVSSVSKWATRNGVKFKDKRNGRNPEFVEALPETGPKYSDRDVLEILHQHINEGRSARDIANELGVSRSGILALVKRIRDADKPDECTKPENLDGGMPERWWA